MATQLPLGYKWWMVADSEGPESYDMSTTMGSRATITIDVDLSKSNRLVNLAYVIADIVGFPTIVPKPVPKAIPMDGSAAISTGVLSRKLPWQHPRLSWLWAEKITKILGRKFQSKKWNPVTALSYSEYNFYRIDIAFSIPPYEVFSDAVVHANPTGNPPTSGLEYLRFTSFESNAGIENITRQGQYLVWANVGGGLLDSNNNPITTNVNVNPNASTVNLNVQGAQLPLYSLSCGNPGPPLTNGFNGPAIPPQNRNPPVSNNEYANASRSLPFPGGVTVRTPKIYYTITWHQVPGLALFGRSGFGRPTNIVNSIGRVNISPWPNFYVAQQPNGTYGLSTIPQQEEYPEETMLYLKYKVRPESVPVAPELISPNITGKIPRTYKVDFEMLYFNPQTTLARGFGGAGTQPGQNAWGTGQVYPSVGHNGAPYPGTSDFYRLSTAANSLDRDSAGNPMNRLYRLWDFNFLFTPSYS